MSNGLTLPFLSLSTSASLSSASIAAAPTRAALKYLKITDITPFGNSDETAQNSEPSLAVNPLDPRQIIAGAFGTKTGSPYFESTDGGNTWNNYGTIAHIDKSIAWLQDGSAALTATLQVVTPNVQNDIVTYSGTIGGSNFGSPINTFVGSAPDAPPHALDQPWIRTGPSDHVYIAYNDPFFAGSAAGGTGNGATAFVLVSTDGLSTPPRGGLNRRVAIDQRSRFPGGALGGEW
jgi:hypothetical protein